MGHDARGGRPSRTAIDYEQSRPPAFRASNDGIAASSSRRRRLPGLVLRLRAAGRLRPRLHVDAVFGNINVGLLLGLGQFVTTFAHHHLVRLVREPQARPAAEELRDDLARDRRRLR